MKRKKRGYDRETPVELVRDYKLFAIACEGNKTEPQYFHLFRYMSNKIAVDVIEDIVSDDEVNSINPNKSAPRWVLDRALRYVEKEGLSSEDELWFVMDIDRWKDSQIREIAQYCDHTPNWKLVLSNPCFEIWLINHFKKLINENVTCKELKNEISTLIKGGYNPLKIIKHLPEAIENSKSVDADINHFYPVKGTTKVYQLGEALISIIGINDFNTFLKKTNHNRPSLKQHKKYFKGKSL